MHEDVGVDEHDHVARRLGRAGVSGLRRPGVRRVATTIVSSGASSTR